MSAMGRINMPPVKDWTTRLGGGVTGQGVSYPGGLDLTTPSLSLQPGALRDGVNFECSQSGGYGRIPGYERFDGRPSPSNASFVVVQIASFVDLPSLGQTLAQATSGATGTIIAINNVAGSSYVAVTQVSGAFDQTHTVSVGATLIGTAVSPTVALSPKTIAQYTAAAADVYRALIGAVPGSGAILGVVGMEFSGVDHVYAFRANVGATAVNLYKATTGGWTQVNFYDLVDFSAGNAATPLDGETLTQGAVTATVKRVMTRSGAWTGTAAGGFVITAPSGGNFAAGAATLSGGATVTLAGAQTAITMVPGGKFQFVKANFSGQSATKRIYGCDGANKAFEFDGDVLAPITTGLSPDAPKFIAFHKNFLILAQQSSFLYSAAGLPYRYSSIDGAGEIATGDDVTGIITLPGSQTTATLAVFQKSNTSFLYGTDPSTFNYVSFNTGVGALPYSVQNLFDSFVFGNLGVISLKTTLNYGNFLPNTLTKSILPFIQQERTKITASCVSFEKSQYRVFFSDGYALWITVVNQQYLGPAVMLFPNPVSCIDTTDTANGSTATYFGSSDGQGYVYQLDVGTSFDGASINAYITLAWDALKSPRILKRFRNASIEVQGGGYTEIQFGYQLGYGTASIGQPQVVTQPASFIGAPQWDVFTWDNFFWDGRTLGPTDVDMTGTAENVQVTLACSGNYFQAFNLNSVIYGYTPRRRLRV
jgi:hypothetical protein